MKRNKEKTLSRDRKKQEMNSELNKRALKLC